MTVPWIRLFFPVKLNIKHVSPSVAEFLFAFTLIVAVDGCSYFETFKTFSEISEKSGLNAIKVDWGVFRKLSIFLEKNRKR